MRITLDIKDNKAAFFMELLKNFKFIKSVEIEEEPTKEEILQGIKEAVEEIKLIKAGKLKGRPAQELFDEL